MTQDIPRRNRIDQYTPAEKAINDAVQAVEAAGAHPRLTDAVNLLGDAFDAVADFVDGTVTTYRRSTPAAPAAGSFDFEEHAAWLDDMAIKMNCSLLSDRAWGIRDHIKTASQASPAGLVAILNSAPPGSDTGAPAAGLAPRRIVPGQIRGMANILYRLFCSVDKPFDSETEYFQQTFCKRAESVIHSVYNLEGQGEPLAAPSPVSASTGLEEVNKQWERLWGPVMDLLQKEGHKVGIRLGDSISDWVLALVKERIAAAPQAPERPTTRRMKLRAEVWAKDLKVWLMDELEETLIISQDIHGSDYRERMQEIAYRINSFEAPNQGETK